MSTGLHDQAPDPFAGPPEVVYYSDGYAGLRYSRPGEGVVLAALAPDASNIRAKIGRDVFCDDDDPTQDGVAILKTAYDRKIGLAGGLAVDMSSLEFREIPDDAVYAVTIEKRSDIPLLGEDPVEEVVLRTPPLWGVGYGMTEEESRELVGQEWAPSDFPALEWVIRDIIAGNNLPMREAARKKMNRAFKGSDAQNTGLTLPSDW